MTGKPPPPPRADEAAASGLGRLLSALLGLVVVGTAAFALFFAETALYRRALLALVLLPFGANLLWSALRGRQSWLWRIGPLP
ncbi:hypothetical protein [Melaminivora alkalimesophila]|uniref:Uncharacterized protein n=1 Tax=Melaminivora alkalimesophila TaxID=1165852 RepID=A0A317RGM9_9BURK|nr:hypothetical protein [Melaminivora alkalimesophila]PWW48983.1 hypothetical protein DFR36_101494 [Melaminivora alkalimesophila]